jgi:ATP-binding cassette subfamily B protein
VYRERLRILRLLRAAGWWVLAALVLVQAVATVLPSLGALVTGVLVHAVAEPHGRGMWQFAWPLTGIATTLLLGQMVESFQPALSFVAARRIDGDLRGMVRRLALAPAGIDDLERPEVQDDLIRASDTGEWRTRTPGTAAVGQLWVMFRFGGAVLAAAVVARFSLPLAVLVFVATFLARAVVRRNWLHLEDIVNTSARQRRRAEYWAELATGPTVAKEIRLFGLGGWVVDGFRHSVLDWYRPLWTARRRGLRHHVAITAVLLGSGFAALAWLAAAAARGELSAGSLTTYALSVLAVYTMGSAGWEVYDIDYGLHALRALDRLRRRVPAVAPQATTGAAGPPRIRLDGVGFRYPGADRAVLDGFTLEIRSGEVIALVGVNGAGKTTLIKLLTGLYEPSAGRVVIDGVPLAPEGVEAWRRRVTVVFQDFNRYELTARENVLLGRGGTADDVDLDRLAAQAGAADVIAELPDGWETVLSREYPGGIDLSGGQWQRIAITRALAGAAGGGLLVLDEPTANLDVQAELDFYDRIIAEAAGCTVVLISHRLSTVRRADRIALLADGAVRECGSHEELMAATGAYAEMFRLQAARFATGGAQ